MRRSSWPETGVFLGCSWGTSTRQDEPSRPIVGPLSLRGEGTLADQPTVFAFGGFEVDEALQELRKEDRPVELQATPLRLLLYLLRNRDRVIPKRELLDGVWSDAAVSEGALSTALNEVRRALGDDGSQQRVIQTLRGRGYRLIASVEEHPAAEAPAVSGADRVVTPADAGGLHLVFTWRNLVLGGVWMLALAGVGAAGWFLLGGEAARGPGAIRSIAVLPLENLTGDPRQEYFADGMTEAVISEFARLGGLSVISRTSVMRYKQSDKSLPEIAQELNVQGVVEGSVVRAGDRVRISLQLIDARNDSHVWAQTYERNLSDVLALQSDVARTVAEQIRLELTPEEQAALTAPQTVDPQAYDAYLRGLELVGEATLVMAWGPSAIEQFERAVELEPNFAGGWAWLAGVRLTLGQGGYNLRYRDQFPKAREAAERALEIDDRLAGPHSVLGTIRLWYDWDVPGARQAYERALQLSPNVPAVLNDYADYLLLVEDRTEEALDLSERLLHVAPLAVLNRGRRVYHFYLVRQYERALEEAERVRGFDAGFASVELVQTYAMLGRLDEAHRTAMALWERCGASCDWMEEAQQRGWATDGWEGSWRAWLESATSAEGFSPVVISGTYAMIGETNEAFTWLERGYRERDPQIIVVKATPIWDPLRSDPRFQDLLRRIGFPED